MADNNNKFSIIVDRQTMTLYSSYRVILIYLIELLIFIFLSMLAFNPKFNLLGFINFRRIMCLVGLLITITSINVLKRISIIVRKISNTITQYSEDKDYIDDVLTYQTGMFTTIQIMILLLRFICAVTVFGFFFSSQLNVFVKVFSSLGVVAFVGSFAYLTKTESTIDKIYWKYSPKEYIEFLNNGNQFDYLDQKLTKKFAEFEKYFIPVVSGEVKLVLIFNYIKSIFKSKQH